MLKSRNKNRTDDGSNPDTPSNADGGGLTQVEQENARLKRAVDELSVLNDLALAIGGSRDPDQVMRRIVRRSMSTIGAEQGLITLVDEKQDDPTETLIRSVSSSGDHEALRPDESLVGWMHINKAALVINDPRMDPRFRGTRWEESVRTILCVPMLVQGRLIGILSLYNKKAAGGFSDDDKRLLSILAAQSAQVLENTRLIEEETQLLKLREQLKLAHDIQARLLPDDNPVLAGFDVAGASIPAQTVGGDFYDIVQVDDSTAVFWVGDVSGKGLPASLTMANTQATLRSHATAGRSSADCAKNSNQLLCRYTPRGTFVTLFLATLDIETGSVRYCNAGHVRPILLRADGSITPLEHNDLVLGFQSDYPYSSAATLMQPGDLMVVYSDGVNEAMNADRDQYGDDRIFDLTKEHQDASCEQLIERVLDSVREHSAGEEQSDDITILCLKRT